MELISCPSTFLYYHLGVISEKVSLKEGVFLGGNDDEQEGTWLWTDKSPGITTLLIGITEF